MKYKSELKKSNDYRDIYIENDTPTYERKLRSNLQTISYTLGKGKLQMRGSRDYERQDPDMRTPRYDN